MMRAVLIAAGVFALATPAVAQVASSVATVTEVGPSATTALTTRRLTIEGSAPVACSLRQIALAAGSTAQITSQQGTTTLVRLGPNFVDPQTAAPTGGRVILDIPIICNGAHTFNVHSTNGRLTHSTGAAGGNGFRNSVDYTLSAVWAGVNQSFSTQAASSLQIPASQATSGDALVTVDIPAGGQPLVAGLYSDSIVVEVAVGL